MVLAFQGKNIVFYVILVYCTFHERKYGRELGLNSGSKILTQSNNSATRLIALYIMIALDFFYHYKLALHHVCIRFGIGCTLKIPKIRFLFVFTQVSFVKCTVVGYLLLISQIQNLYLNFMRS
jgi:hypothetical protein